MLTGRSAEWSAVALDHQRIHMDSPEFFQDDGVYLSDLGLDVFLEDIKGACLLSLIGLMAAMGLSKASPYAVVGSADVTGFW